MQRQLIATLALQLITFCNRNYFYAFACIANSFAVAHVFVFHSLFIYNLFDGVAKAFVYFLTIVASVVCDQHRIYLLGTVVNIFFKVLLIAFRVHVPSTCVGDLRHMEFMTHLKVVWQATSKDSETLSF